MEGISTRSAGVRIATAGVAVLTLVIAIAGAKWQLGDMLATLTAPTDANAAIIADAAVGLAPADARASALRAEVGEDATSGDTRSPIDIAEEAVRLAPSDHRWRLTLARALADNGDLEKAEGQLKQAIDLAPHYAVCRWYYGNFLLRQGRREEGIAQFKVAAAENPDYREQVLALMWDYSAHDPNALLAVAGDGADNFAQLAHFFAGHGRGAEALKVWDQLSGPDKAARDSIARVIAQGLFEQRNFSQALELSKQLGDDADASFEAVANGSFETALRLTETSRFGWGILRTDPKLEVALDNRVRHEGSRSLRLTFKGTSKAELFNTVQVVAVRPGSRYRLTFWIRTENLKSAAGPLLDVASGDEAKTLARTEAFTNGTNDWRQMTLDFTSPPAPDGIEIRTLRAACSGDDCPITGIIWYDDFVLTRL